MSNLWFNIRFGKWHWQLTRDWEIRFSKNTYWDHAPDVYKEEGKFAVYCAFGTHYL